MDRRLTTRVREGLDPLGDPPLTEVDEAGHVGGRARRHHERNRRHETRRDTGAPQDNVDKASTYAAVAVDEWMDGLELSVRDRSLSDWWEVVTLEERGEILEEADQLVLRGRHEFGVEGTIQAAA